MTEHPHETDEALEVALEAMATGREDLVPGELRRRIEGDEALRDRLAEARALSIDVGMALRDAPMPEVDLDALVARAMDAAPAAPSRRSLWLAATAGLVATLGLGLAAIGGLPTVGTVLSVGGAGWTLAAALDHLVSAFPGGYAGLGLALFALALLLGWPLRALTRASVPALLALSTMLGSTAIGHAQRFEGAWPEGETVSVDAEAEPASAVLRRACEAAGLGYVSHLGGGDAPVSVHVQNAPLREVLAAVLPRESTAVRSGDLVIVHSREAEAEAEAEAVAEAVAVATHPGVVATVASAPPIPPMPPAASIGRERATMGRDITVGADEIVADVTTMGGDATIDGQVIGDVVTMGGDVTVRGLVRGAVLTMGGDIALEDDGRILGEMITMGGDVSRDGEADQDPPDRHESRASAAASIFGSAARHGLVFLLGVLLIGAFPRRHASMARLLVDRPVRAAGAGFLGVLATLVLCLAFAITLVGIPVALFLAVVAVVAACAGLAVVAYVIGAALPVKRASKRPLLQLGLGVLVLWALSLVPFLGFLVLVVLGSAGYGAVLLTRFGRPDLDA